jgi:hypothetical protein
MMIVEWSPEMGVFVVDYKGRQTIVSPDELHGKYAGCRQIFEQARQAVESGRAVLGVHADLE